ncbi:CD1247 N-terminal domain-containing protein [Acutalibacter caecimuris]|uniref:CD1247 N-terminal domain-containing protein n=1 Tax=Acutalibacter caecimuris TaxID=3093657 RepID=UPI002AC8E33A|nr:CD1247 N-terminal domain-containing protein [Acutalibacter sp. M00118]
MTNSERASYIRGMMDGMELDTNAKETKLFHAMAELLSELSTTVDELEDELSELAEQVDEVDRDLGDLEEEYYGLDDEDCGCHHHDEGEGCGCHHHGGGEGCGCHHHHEAIFEAICPNCGENIELTEEMLAEEQMLCPNCGETLEFDFDDEDDFEEEEGESAGEESSEE